MRRYEGITLIALIITVIVMLILAGVALSAISGDTGLFDRVQKTAELYNNQAQTEADTVNKIIDMLDEEYMKDINKGANEPDLVEGMKPVIFDESNGTTKTPQTNAEWYNYDNKQWANAETEDGSLWVWIPRFAYKITYYTDATKKEIKGTRDNDGYKKADGTVVRNTGVEAETAVDTIGTEVKSGYGSIDVVFLHDTSNQYYKEEGEKIISRNAVDDGYIIHPAFVNGRENYSNGEFNRELTGFWMAKFQAGFQYGDNGNSAGVNQKNGKDIKRSSVSYTKNQVWVPAVESGSSDSWQTARNYLDGEYGNSLPKISYPVFKGNNYAMNYITIGESYSLAQALNEDGNMYGFKETDSDTHLTKNSEWGAVAYLGYSKYGLDGKNIHINNKSLNNSVKSVYGVTGWAASNADAATNVDPQLWYTTTGQTGSNTGNITGVYDMSGCTWERVAMYIENGHGNLSTYGSSFVTTKTSNDVIGESTEYATMYKHNTTYDNKTTQTGITDDKRKQASRNNYKQNDEKYGDAIYETSTSGEYLSKTGFNSDYSSFSHLYYPFIARGGYWHDTTLAGLFAFYRTFGIPNYNGGFRAVVCPV